MATVSLFKETYNKEFSSSVGGKPIILANLLQSIGMPSVVLATPFARNVLERL